MFIFILYLMIKPYKYHELDLDDSATWTNYLNRISNIPKDIYYTPEYYKLYEELGDGKALCFVFEYENDIAIYPFLINSVNNIGYQLDHEYYDIQGAYGYNGFLTSNTDDKFLARFESAFTQYCNEKRIIAEFTRFHPLLGNQLYSKELNVINDRETVFLDLSQTWDYIWTNEFSSKNRNMIRKAEKIGYKCEIISKPDRAAIDEFIMIYHRSMKLVNANNYYFFNHQYFHNTFKYLCDSSFLFNIKNEMGDTVCSSIFFKFGDYFHYHLSGRSEQADNAVNNFLLSEAIKYAKTLAIKFIHLGGGRTNSEEDSLLKFKKSFSKSSSLFSIGKRIHDGIIYSKVEQDWISRYPLEVEKNRNFLLKYRLKNN